MAEKKLKLIRTSTVPESLNLLMKNQFRFLNQYFNIIAVASPGEQLNEIRDREGVPIHEIKMERDISPVKDLLSLITWIKYLKKERPDIIHSHTPKSSLISMLAAKFCRVPIRIITINGLRFETLTGFKRWIVVNLYRASCWGATHITSEGNGVKNKLLKEKITSKEIYIIGRGNLNGIDLDYWNINQVGANEIAELKTKYALENVFTFIYVGRLVKDKGIKELMEAFEKLNAQFVKTRLILVGYYEKGIDELSPNILQKIEYNPNIMHVGFQKDIRPWLMLGKVLILPSYREGFPNVILQAGAMKIPVIVTEVNGADEVINGTNGVIIPVKNTDALLKQMINFAEGKYDIEKMGACAEKIIQNDFNQVAFYHELIGYYRKIISHE